MNKLFVELVGSVAVVGAIALSPGARGGEYAKQSPPAADKKDAKATAKKAGAAAAKKADAGAEEAARQARFAKWRAQIKLGSTNYHAAMELKELPAEEGVVDIDGAVVIGNPIAANPRKPASVNYDIVVRISDLSTNRLIVTEKIGEFVDVRGVGGRRQPFRDQFPMVRGRYKVVVTAERPSMQPGGEPTWIALKGHVVTVK